MKLFTLSVLVLCAGCAHAPKGPKTANPAEVEKVAKRAALDLSCPAESVTVEVLEAGGLMTPWTFAARGCERSATYLSRAGTLFRN